MKLASKILAQITLLLVCAAMVMAIAPAAYADHIQPKAFIADLGERTVHALADESMTPEDRKKKFRNLFLEGFDVRTLGRFAVGRYWRKATKQQQTEYRRLFTEYIVQTYASRFGQYSGETLKVAGQRATGKYDTIVKSSLVRPRGAPVLIDWRVRDHKHKMNIIDIVVEGVSMAITQREEFASVIRRGGGDFNVLIDVLKKKIGE